MFGHLFPSHRSTASPPLAFKTGPSPGKASARPLSKFTQKLQALKQVLKPRRSGTKVIGDGPTICGTKHVTGEPTAPYEKSGNSARHARSLVNRRREGFSSSTTSGLLPAGTTSTTRSATPHPSLPGPFNAPPTPLGPIVQASSLSPPGLQGLAMPSDPEKDYPPARKRIRELRAMKVTLGCDEVQGMKTTHAYHVKVVAPRTTTTFPPPSWEVTTLEYANKPTPVTELHERGSRVHQERNLLNAGVYQARRCFSHENPIRTPAPDPSRWLGEEQYNEPIRNPKPDRKRSPLLDSATVPVGQKLLERLGRSQNLDSSQH
ncbi:hypothetical protein FRC00_005093 [Tulasnella sp. 408]|nr:hypothetical protein FRC00_005093 [Tulasnella sp. 408]